MRAAVYLRVRLDASCRIAVRSFNKMNAPGDAAAHRADSTSGHAENHAISRAHGAPRTRPDVASLGRLWRRELLRLAARPRIRGHPERGGAARRLTTLQVPHQRTRCRAPPRPHGHAQRREAESRASDVHRMV